MNLLQEIKLNIKRCYFLQCCIIYLSTSLLTGTSFASSYEGLSGSKIRDPFKWRHNQHIQGMNPSSQLPDTLMEETQQATCDNGLSHFVIFLPVDCFGQFDRIACGTQMHLRASTEQKGSKRSDEKLPYDFP